MLFYTFFCTQLLWGETQSLKEVETETEVEFPGYGIFGGVTFEGGPPVNITCNVLNRSPGRSLTWINEGVLGVEPFSVTIPTKTITVKIPQIEKDDRRNVTCKCGSASSSLQIKVYILDLLLASKLHNSTANRSSDALELLVEVKLWPHPKVRWIIDSPHSGRILLRHGQQEEPFSAKVQMTRSSFIFSLKLMQLNDHVLDSNISVAISAAGATRSISFVLEKQRLLEGEPDDKLPWYIWLGISGLIIVFITIIIIVIWRRKKDGDEVFTSHLGNVYLETPQEETST